MSAPRWWASVDENPEDLTAQEYEDRKVNAVLAGCTPEDLAEVGIDADRS